MTIAINTQLYSPDLYGCILAPDYYIPMYAVYIILSPMSRNWHNSNTRFYGSNIDLMTSIQLLNDFLSHYENLKPMDFGEMITSNFSCFGVNVFQIFKTSEKINLVRCGMDSYEVKELVIF